MDYFIADEMREEGEEEVESKEGEGEGEKMMVGGERDGILGSGMAKMKEEEEERRTRNTF